MARRYLVAALAVVLLAGSLPGASAAAGPFDDVDSVAWYAEAINGLDERGIFDGTECADNRFCPSEPLDRWVFAVWLIRVLDAQVTIGGPSRFADVDPSDWYAPYTEELGALGVTTGCAVQPLRYCPHQTVTRAQMATFLVRALDLEPAAPAGFADTAGSVHSASIDALAAAGITAGCGDGTRFCPHDPLTRAEMAVFLFRATSDPSQPDQPADADPRGSDQPPETQPAEPQVEPDTCSFGDHSDRVRAATWQVYTGDSIGTAFYIGDGDWITAAHVIEGYDQVTLQHTSRSIEVTVEAAVPEADLALLTGPEPRNVQPLKLGDVHRVKAGTDVYTVGYPLYLSPEPAVSRGVLSRIETWLETGEVVVTDAAVNPGNSGGPLVDTCGRVIGVIVAKYTEVRVEGLAYAVSDGTVREYLPAMKAGEWEPTKPVSAWTGSAYGGRGTVSAGSWKAHIEDPSTGMLVTLDCWQGGSPSSVLLSLTIGQWQWKWFHSYLIRYKVGEADWVLIGHDHLWHSSDQGQGRLQVFDTAWISEDTRPTKLFIQAIRAAETGDSLAIEAWVNDDEDYGGDWHLLGEGEVDVWNGRQYVESTIAACGGAVGFQGDRVRY